MESWCALLSKGSNGLKVVWLTEQLTEGRDLSIHHHASVLLGCVLPYEALCQPHRTERAARDLLCEAHSRLHQVRKWHDTAHEAPSQWVCCFHNPPVSASSIAASTPAIEGRLCVEASSGVNPTRTNRTENLAVSAATRMSQARASVERGLSFGAERDDPA